MKFDSPAEVYERALPDGFRFDPSDERSTHYHDAGLAEAARVHPVGRWRYRRDGFSDGDINVCMQILYKSCGDDYEQVAAQEFTKKQMVAWRQRRSRHVEIKNSRDGRYRQWLVNVGEHPDDVAGAVRTP